MSHREACLPRSHTHRACYFILCWQNGLKQTCQRSSEMRRILVLLLCTLTLLSACAAPATPALRPVLTPVAQTSIPSQPTSLPLTSVESALAPGNSTAAPATDIIASHTVTFSTSDGGEISGELYGSGKTAVIFSVMGNCKRGWREFAQLTAAQGLMALTYQWRGCRESGPVDEDEIQKFVDDLRGAIQFMRGQGAEKIILAGASLGGSASAKLAAESDA